MLGVCDLTHIFVCNEEQCNNNAENIRYHRPKFGPGFVHFCYSQNWNTWCGLSLRKYFKDGSNEWNSLRFVLSLLSQNSSLFPILFLLSTAVFCDVQARLLLHFQQPFFRNVRARLLFSLALFSSHDCKHLEKCPARALFLSKKSVRCINVTKGMAYNSLRSLDTISLLVNAADSTLYTAELIPMTVEKKQTPCPCYLTYTQQVCPPAPPASSAAKKTTNAL